MTHRHFRRPESLTQHSECTVGVEKGGKWGVDEGGEWPEELITTDGAFYDKNPKMSYL